MSSDEDSSSEIVFDLSPSRSKSPPPKRGTRSTPQRTTRGRAAAKPPAKPATRKSVKKEESEDEPSDDETSDDDSDDFLETPPKKAKSTPRKATPKKAPAPKAKPAPKTTKKPVKEESEEEDLLDALEEESSDYDDDQPLVKLVPKTPAKRNSTGKRKRGATDLDDEDAPKVCHFTLRYFQSFKFLLKFSIQKKKTKQEAAEERRLKRLNEEMPEFKWWLEVSYNFFVLS
jgi:hypothetical protein